MRNSTLLLIYCPLNNISISSFTLINVHEVRKSTLVCFLLSLNFKGNNNYEHFMILMFFSVCDICMEYFNSYFLQYIHDTFFYSRTKCKTLQFTKNILLEMGK